MVFRLRARERARLSEMFAVDAAREGMNVGMTVLFGFEQAVPAGEHHVGAREKFFFEPHEFGRGEFEGR